MNSKLIMLTINQVNAKIKSIIKSNFASEYVEQYNELKDYDLEGIPMDYLVQKPYVQQLIQTNYTDELANALYYAWDDEYYESFDAFVEANIADTYEEWRYDTTNPDMVDEYTPNQWLHHFTNS